MTKESIYEYQLIDCNCNDCKHLCRSFDIQNNTLDANKKLQEEMFYMAKEMTILSIRKDIANLVKNRLLVNRADEKISGKRERLAAIQKETFHFQGDRTPIQYGTCSKFSKEITFIPVTCQIETQDCFEHRKKQKPEGIIPSGL